MLYLFDMDFRFSGILRPAPPHPGLSTWTEVVEDWAERKDLSLPDRVAVMTVAAELGSEVGRSKLEEEVCRIEHMDGSEWTGDGAVQHTLSHALRVVQRQSPSLSAALIDRIVASERYNVAMVGISALQACGDAGALRRLIELYQAKSDRYLRDSIANAIELVAARVGVVIQKVGGQYQMAG